jgi:hypothetical protein
LERQPDTGVRATEAFSARMKAETISDHFQGLANAVRKTGHIRSGLRRAAICNPLRFGLGLWYNAVMFNSEGGRSWTLP